MRRRAATGTPVMDLAHELKASNEGSRVTVHGIAPALRTYLRPQFDPDTGESEGPRLVFLHFMKVGGTSLSALFANWVAEERLIVHAFIDDIALIPPPVLANLRLIAGHLPFAALALVPPPYRTMAVLRDPLSRTVSHYSHLRQVDPRFEGLTLEQFVFDDAYHSLSGNYQARQLGHDMDLANAWRSYSPEYRVVATGADPFFERPLAALFDSGPMSLSEDELLQTASAHLRQIDFVGVTDHLDDIARQAAALFGVPPEPVARLNPSPPFVRGDIDGRIRRRIEARTAIDRELYDLARRR
jgi:hypothetical protein